VKRKPRAFILSVENLLAVDASGIRALEELHGESVRSGTRFIIAGLHKQPLFALGQAGLVEKIGEENICGTLAEAVERVAVERVERGPAK
jgi:SulP family sulfate permease